MMLPGSDWLMFGVTSVPRASFIQPCWRDFDVHNWKITMQFSGRKKKVTLNQQNELYGHCLQFYCQPPLENISLNEFEGFAVDRLKLLKTVENLGVSYVKTTEQYKKKLQTEFSSLGFPHREELISAEEKTHFKDQLINSSYSVSGTTVAEQDFYKVPFQDALDLVRTRKVFLKAGYAYIPHQEIVAIVLNDFRTRLSKALALTARSLPAVQSDERLQPLLNHLSHAYVGQDYSIQKNVGKVSLEQIDPLSTKSFPLCMRQLHKALRENHHLRHGGRMQYGLFLKGIGLTLDQALQFWRSEFVKGKVDADKFDKAYAYSIRHMFGKEGKRTDYTPYSCMKVILSNPPSQGDYHGCPFRHSDPELLKQKLQSYKLSPGGIMQILDLVKGMHYQLACQKYFELTHNIDDAGFSLNHPNQYFIESQRLLSGGKEVKKEAEMPQRGQENTASNVPSVPPSRKSSSTQAVDDIGDLESYFIDE
ncbi:DNA primase large subunit isoform X2 [Tachysurus fulvidraco]|uniref:DNA primase large subunit isoform X2 n=1 Tax=Tachysurus fulvidraco TaxID=1234273 RepID=UPI001FF06EBD|nr:DNA primase large subunit isoform X2 [Tachysurus fulvidraco]